MDTDLILPYLTALQDHNERSWYHAHKKEYQAANAQFEALLQELIFRLSETDQAIPRHEPKELTFKLARDTRFSHDKSPYNPAFRAHIGPKGKLPVPVGYYIMLKPGASFLGGGLFADLFKDATEMIRAHIAAHPDVWEEILEEETFKSTFTVQGSTLKNVPRGYDRDHPQAKYLKYKSWYLTYPVGDAVVQDAGAFLDTAVEVFQKMERFHRFLNEALAGFEMSRR